ncbi:MAG TPA: class I SAM-dependent methyltransferase [Candidatus Methanoperedens sp.]
MEELREAGFRSGSWRGNHKIRIKKMDNTTEQKLKKCYNVGWEKVWAKELDKQYNPLSKYYNNRMLDCIGLIKEETNCHFKLLDVGCGIGIYSINILKKFNNCILFGFDISEKQIDFINDKLVNLGLKDRCKFFVDDANNFNLNQKFDYIICTELLEHLTNPIQTLENIYEHGSIHTKFVFSVPHIYGSGESGWFYRQFVNRDQWIETQDFSKIDPNKEYYEFYHKQYSIEEIETLLRDNKFEILEIKYSNFNFKNEKLNFGYSLFAYPIIDKILNKITLNRYSSQITLLCKKRDFIEMTR